MFYIPFKGKERPEQKKLFLVKLCAVLVSFGSSENFIVDSANSLELEIFKNLKNLFDSAQC